MGSLYSVCGIRGARSCGVSCESVAVPPEGEGVLGELESAIPVGGGRWTGRAPGGFLGELGRFWNPGCGKGFTEG